MNAIASEAARTSALVVLTLLLLACGLSAPFVSTDAPPVVLPVSVPVIGLPAGYHAELIDVLVLMTAPLQSTSPLADREALAAIAKAYPHKRVCVMGVDTESAQQDLNGNTWHWSLGVFCMPPLESKTRALR